MAMQYLPGSLEIDNVPYDTEIWRLLHEELKNLDGYFAYKIPVLGTPSPKDVPTFIIVTKEHGITLIDVFHEKLEDI